MRLIAVIQARLGSERLPGKVLKPIGGKPVIAHVIDRVRRSDAFDGIVVATTDKPSDDRLAQAADGLGASVVRGDEADVLSRFVLAADMAGADALARITADCPLIDPGVMAAMARRFRNEACDCLTNARLRTFPRGLDVEFLTACALRDADANGRRPHHREHVTPWLYEHPDRYRILDFVDEEDLSGWRWTLDTPEDLDLITRLIESAEGEMLPYTAFARIYADHPEWHAINAHVEQKKAS